MVSEYAPVPIEHHEEFRTDCRQWNGYWPCPVQRRTVQPTCAGCPSYEPAPTGVEPKPTLPYDPALLASAARVGLVEMGGLGSHLRTTALTRAIRQRNPLVEIHWFTHSRGAELVQYIPAVRPVDVQTRPAPAGLVAGLDVLINLEFDHARPIVPHARCVAGFRLNRFGKFEPASPHAYRLQRLQIDNAARTASTQTMQRVLLDAVGLDDAPAGYDEPVIPSSLWRAAGRRMAGVAPAGGRVVGLFVGSSRKGALKRWPPRSWTILAGR